MYLMKYSLLFLMLFSCACNVPLEFNNEVVITETLKSNCPDSYKYINKHWKKHNRRNCYYVSERFYYKRFLSIFEDCFTDLEMIEIEKVIGPPTSISVARDSIYSRFDVYRYSLTPTGNCMTRKWQLQFYVSPSTNIVEKVRKF